MDIEFGSTKLAKQMNDDSSLARVFGPEQARKIRARLDDLDAVATLEEMRNLPHVRAFNDFIASRTAALRHMIEGRAQNR